MTRVAVSKQLIIGSELSDLFHGNLRLSQGKLYLVDFGAITTSIRGMCFSKPFLEWFEKPEPRERFLDGYNSVSNADFLTPEYLQFIYLNFLIRKTQGLHIRNKPLEKIQQRILSNLELLLQGELE